MNKINTPVDRFYTNGGYGGNKELKDPLQSLKIYRAKVNQKIKMKKKIFLPLKTKKGQFLDYKEYIFQKRQILENIKATQYERDFNNLYIERQKKQKLKEQRAEMQYLLNKYKNSIFSFILSNSEKNIQQQQREEILEQEGELIQFEKTALNQINKIEEIEQLRMKNDETRDDLKTRINSINSNLESYFSSISSKDELEEVRSILDDIAPIQKDIFNTGDTNEEESVDLQEPRETVQSNLLEYGFEINSKEQEEIQGILEDEMKQEKEEENDFDELLNRVSKMEQKTKSFQERGQKIQETRLKNLNEAKEKLIKVFDKNKKIITRIRKDFDKMETLGLPSDLTPKNISTKIDYLAQFLPPSDVDAIRIRFGGKLEKNLQNLTEFNKLIKDFKNSSANRLQGFKKEDFNKDLIKKFTQINQVNKLRDRLKKFF